MVLNSQTCSSVDAVHCLWAVRLYFFTLGIAKLVSESRHDIRQVSWVLPPGISQSQLGGIFKLDWIHRYTFIHEYSRMCILCSVFIDNRGAVEFSVCMDLKNPWNDNKPVKISRDGQVGLCVVYIRT